MAAPRYDQWGVEEIISWVDKDVVRLCPIHRKVFDSDPVVYRGAGRLCNCGGLPMVGYLARRREQSGEGQSDFEDWFSSEG